MGTPVSISTIPTAASSGREKKVLNTRQAQNKITIAGTTG